MHLFFVLAGILLSSCLAQRPVISDIQHDVIKVQIDPNLFVKQPTQQEILQEAARGCGIYGRLPSNIISQRTFSISSFEARTEYLIACAPADGED